VASACVLSVPEQQHWRQHGCDTCPQHHRGYRWCCGACIDAMPQGERAIANEVSLASSLHWKRNSQKIDLHWSKMNSLFVDLADRQ
jgi:hypothetical protein